MKRFVDHRAKSGTHVINLEHTYERIRLAARVIVAVDDASDVIVKPHAPALLTPPGGLRPPLRPARSNKIRAAHRRHCVLLAALDPGNPHQLQHQEVPGAPAADCDRPPHGPPGGDRGLLREHSHHRPVRLRLAAGIRGHRDPLQQPQHRVHFADLLAARPRGPVPPWQHFER